jgi:S-adenosylmethionine synthetase
MGQIGAPITETALLHVKLATRNGIAVRQFKRRVDETSRSLLSRTSELVDDFISGTIDVF